MGLLNDLVSGVTRSVITELETKALPNVLSDVLANTDLGSVGGLLKTLQQGGLERQVDSWLGNGSNLPISPDQLRNALGDERVRQIATSAGIPIDELLKGFAQRLPETVDHMSPDGTLEESAADSETSDQQGGSLADQAGLNDIRAR
jgi:uncharacterized protein YidB (DUF937 family)